MIPSLCFKNLFPGQMLPERSQINKKIADLFQSDFYPFFPQNSVDTFKINIRNDGLHRIMVLSFPHTDFASPVSRKFLHNISSYFTCPCLSISLFRMFHPQFRFFFRPERAATCLFLFSLFSLFVRDCVRYLFAFFIPPFPRWIWTVVFPRFEYRYG